MNHSRALHLVLVSEGVSHFIRDGVGSTSKTQNGGLLRRSEVVCMDFSCGYKTDWHPGVIGPDGHKFYHSQFYTP